MNEGGKIKALWDSLGVDYDLGTLDEFQSKLADSSKRKAFHDYFSNEYDLGTLEEFEFKLLPEISKSIPMGEDQFLLPPQEIPPRTLQDIEAEALPGRRPLPQIPRLPEVFQPEPMTGNIDEDIDRLTRNIAREPTLALASAPEMIGAVLDDPLRGSANILLGLTKAMTAPLTALHLDPRIIYWKNFGTPAQQEAAQRIVDEAEAIWTAAPLTTSLMTGGMLLKGGAIGLGATRGIRALAARTKGQRIAEKLGGEATTEPPVVSVMPETANPEAVPLTPKAKAARKNMMAKPSAKPREPTRVEPTPRPEVPIRPTEPAVEATMPVVTTNQTESDYSIYTEAPGDVTLNRFTGKYEATVRISSNETEPVGSYDNTMDAWKAIETRVASRKIEEPTKAAAEARIGATYAAYEPMREINLDVERFQNRIGEKFSEETASDIALNYDPNSFDPIVIWKDPKDGNNYVLAGHSRYEGLRRRGEEVIPARYFKGSEDEAIQWAKVESNRLANAESLASEIKAYKIAKESGMSQAKLKTRFKADTDFLEAWGYLNQEGDWIMALGNKAEFPHVKRFARWVGTLRKTYPDKMSNYHETQLFDFIYRGTKDEAKLGQFGKEEFFDLVESQIGQLGFDPETPLVMKRGGAVITGLKAKANLEHLFKERDDLVARRRLALTPQETGELTGRIIKLEQEIEEADKAQAGLFETIYNPDEMKLQAFDPQAWNELAGRLDAGWKPSAEEYNGLVKSILSRDPTEPHPLEKIAPQETLGLGIAAKVPKSPQQIKTEQLANRRELNELRFGVKPEKAPEGKPLSVGEQLEGLYEAGKVPQSKAKGWISDLWNRTIYDFKEMVVYIPELPRTGEAGVRFAPARNLLRTVRSRALGKIIPLYEEFNAILSPLDGPGYDAFNRFIFLRDLINTVDKGKPVPLPISQRLYDLTQAHVKAKTVVERFALEAEIRLEKSNLVNELRPQLDELKQKIMTLPEWKRQAITRAVERQDALTLSIGRDLFTRGHIDKEAANDVSYFPHLVLDYMGQQFNAGIPRKLKLAFRPYAIHRKGSMKPYMTDYIESKLRVYRDIAYNNAVDDLVNELATLYDANRKHSDLGLQVGMIDPDTGFPLVEYTVGRSLHIYPSITPGNQLMSQLMKAIYEDKDNVNLMGIQEAKMPIRLIIAGGKDKILIPEPLSKAIANIPSVELQVPSGVARAVQQWKRLQIGMNPVRYNVRNWLGDSERLFAAYGVAPFKYIPEAIRTLIKENEDYWYSLSQGNIGQGKSGGAELGRIARDFPNIDKFLNAYKSPKSAATAWAKETFKQLPLPFSPSVVRFTQFRENILRLATELWLRDEMKAGRFHHPTGNWKHAQEVAKVRGVNEAAAMVARETMGDYAKFTKFENRLRNGILPFYSWRWINTSFWPTVAYNTLTGKGLKAPTLLATGFRLGRGAVRLGTWMAKINASYMALYAWNNATEKRRAYEQSLSDWERSLPHFLYEDETGVAKWSQPFASTDFIQAMGMDDVPYRVLDGVAAWNRGEISGNDLITEMIWNDLGEVPQRMLFEWLGQISPVGQFGLRFGLGFETFPELFNRYDALTYRAFVSGMLNIVPTDVRRLSRAAIEQWRQTPEGKELFKELPDHVRHMIEARGYKVTFAEALMYWIHGSSYKHYDLDEIFRRADSAFDRASKMGPIPGMKVPRKNKLQQYRRAQSRLEAAQRIRQMGGQ